MFVPLHTKSHFSLGYGTASIEELVDRAAALGYPALALTDLDGHARSLPAPQGRRVLVNVWASWCGPCRDEMPLLDRFAQAQGTGGIAVVGIAQDDAASVRGYLRQVPTAYPILLDDAQGNAGVRLGNRLGALPYSVLIDAKGRLLRRKYGPFASARALQEWIAEPGQNP